MLLEGALRSVIITLPLARPCLNLWLAASSPTLSSLTAYVDKTALDTSISHNFNFFRYFFSRADFITDEMCLHEVIDFSTLLSRPGYVGSKIWSPSTVIATFSYHCVRCALTLTTSHLRFPVMITYHDDVWVPFQSRQSLSVVDCFHQVVTEHR